MTDSISEEATSPPRSLVRSSIKRLLFLGVAAALIYVSVFRNPAAPATKSGRSSGPVSVSVAKATLADMDVTIPALGTATASNSVTLRSRVDGELMKVHFEEGAEVRKGDLLLEIDPRPFEVQKLQAEAQLARDAAQLENAKVDLARFSTLLKQDSIPQQQVDTQSALVRQYEAAMKLDDAQVAAAALQLRYTRITAPISGRIGLRSVDEGNIVHASDATGIALITQIRPINVVFSIPQNFIPQVAARMAAPEPMIAEAIDRDGKTVLATGKVETLDNQIDTSTGTVRLMAEFPNDDDKLFPNQFVNISLKAEHLKGVTVVPVAAVQHGVNGSYLYVVKDGQSVSVRQVETGATENGVTRIVDGISNGDVVVVDGIDKLREGAQIKIADAPGGRKATPESSPPRADDKH